MDLILKELRQQQTLRYNYAKYVTHLLRLNLPPTPFSLEISHSQNAFRYAFILLSNCLDSLNFQNGNTFLIIIVGAVNPWCTIKKRRSVPFYISRKGKLLLFQLSSCQSFIPNMMHPTPLNYEVILKQKDKNTHFKQCM